MCLKCLKVCLNGPNISKVEFQRCLKEKEKIRRVGLNPSPTWKPKIYESNTWTWLEIPTDLPKAHHVRLGLVGFRIAQSPSHFAYKGRPYPVSVQDFRVCLSLLLSSQICGSTTKPAASAGLFSRFVIILALLIVFHFLYI